MIAAINELTETEREEAKEKVEEVLKEYPLLKSKIKIEKIKSNKDFSLEAMAYDQVGPGKKNEVYSDVEGFTVDKIEAGEKVVELIKKLRIIEEAFNSLNDLEKETIKLIYFRGYKEADAAEMCEEPKSRRTIQNYKKSALKKLMKLEVHKL